MLTERVAFSAVLQKGNRVQVPRLVRWRYKLDSKQVLKVAVTSVNLWTGWHVFYARMGRDGRITVPKLTRQLLQGRESSLEGCVLSVTLDPA
jgi:hypothetical protein